MRQTSREIDGEAAAWAARIDARPLSAIEEDELQRWLAGDRRRRGALLRAEATWQALGTAMLASMPDDRSRDVAAPARTRRVTRRYVVGVGGGALAASIAGGLLVGSGIRYTTDLGEIRRVPLSDGSTAAINTSSTVAIRFEAERRAVTLERGEAWFHVAHDARRPFVVTAGDIMVQAIGTAFAVRRRGATTEIGVTEGVVKVSSQDGIGGGAVVAIASGGHAEFAGGRLIDQARGDEALLDRRLSWREGKIDFVDATLDEAASEFNRYNRRRLVIVDPMLAAERLDGIFSVDDVPGFATAIHKSLGVPIELRDTEVRIGGKK